MLAAREMGMKPIIMPIKKSDLAQYFCLSF
jgi:hypothetical protein